MVYALPFVFGTQHRQPKGSQVFSDLFPAHAVMNFEVITPPLVAKGNGPAPFVSQLVPFEMNHIASTGLTFPDGHEFSEIKRAEILTEIYIRDVLISSGRVSQRSRDTVQMFD